MPSSKYNKQTQKFSIPKTIFRRLVKQIMREQIDHGTLLREPRAWYDKAMDALQTDTEEYITEKFQEAAEVCDLVGQKTVQHKYFLKAAKLNSSISNNNTHLAGI